MRNMLSKKYVLDCIDIFLIESLSSMIEKNICKKNNKRHDLLLNLMKNNIGISSTYNENKEKIVLY